MLGLRVLGLRVLGLSAFKLKELGLVPVVGCVIFIPLKSHLNLVENGYSLRIIGTVVCILVRTASFQDSEETIHSAEKNDASYKRAGFFTKMRQKKIQNGRLRKFKMAASKKPHFPAPPILNIFPRNFYGLVLGLVKFIEGMAQLI